MITRETTIRVHYYETDKMGVVHHSNYLRYYETARTEVLREFGTTYTEMEEAGVMLPVLNVESKYLCPAYDDDLLRIRVTLKKLPVVKMRFDYEIYRVNEGEEEQLINTGHVTLAFMNAKTRRACRAPQYFIDILTPYFAEK